MKVRRSSNWLDQRLSLKRKQ